MKRLVLCLSCLLFMSIPALAASVSYIWDASIPDAEHPTPANGYNVYTCTDSALNSCTSIDVGNVQLVYLDLSTGSYWIFVRAYSFEISGTDANGSFRSGAKIESTNSNVVATYVHVPPGNPKNVKVR